jgi:hypothetical protein
MVECFEFFGANLVENKFIKRQPMIPTSLLGAVHKLVNTNKKGVGIAFDQAKALEVGYKE